MRGFVVLAIAACGGSDGSGDAGAPAKSGSINVQSYTAEQPPGSAIEGGGVFASFGASPSTCIRDVQGECTVLECPTGAATLASAGTLAIDGAAMPLSLPPNDDKSYTSLMSPTALYAGGETLAFSATGGDVPAFSESVTAPAKAQITSPAKSSPLTVDRAVGLRVTWTAGGGKIQVALFAGTTSAVSVSCRFPAEAGAGIIPPVALTSLPAGQGGFAIAAVADTTIDAGDWRIGLDAYYNAVWPDNSIASGPTMVQ